MSKERSEFLNFASFIVTGGLAALANLVARYLLMTVMSYEWSVAFAYLIGMIVAFILARTFVFLSGDRAIASEFGRFAIVNVFSFAMVWLVTIGLVRYLFPAIKFEWHPNEVGHFIGVLSPIVQSYYGHKYFSFKGANSPKIAGDKS